MRTPRICLLCRNNILASPFRERQFRQWQRPASFVSLNHPQSDLEIPTSSDVRWTKRTTRSGQGKRNSNVQAKAQRSGHKIPDSGDFLEALFEESRNADSSVTTGPVKPSAEQLALYGHVETLDKMLADPKVSVVKSWLYLVENLNPQVWASTPSEPSSFHSTSSTLVEQLLKAKSTNISVQDLPPMCEVASIFAALGRLPTTQWNAMLWTCLRAFSQQSKTTDRNALAADLLGTWRVGYNLRASRAATISASKQEDSKNWSWVRPLDIRTIMRAKAQDASARTLIEQILPEFGSPGTRKHRSKPKTLASAAIVTLALLAKRSNDQSYHDILREPFLNLLADLLLKARIGPSDLKEILEADRIDWLEDVDLDFEQILHVAGMMSQADGSLTEVKTERRTNANHADMDKSDARNVNTILHQLVGNRDLRTTARLWSQFLSGDSEIGRFAKSTFDASPDLSKEIHERFIMEFTRLRQPDRAIDVWNQMIQNSFEPSLKAWNAMLVGCKLSRSVESIESVWKSLMSSGRRPDHVCWTTRISGLIDAGQSVMAVKALEEMGLIWKNAAMKQKHLQPDLAQLGDINGTVKPTIETINAVVSGLLRKKQSSAAHKMLEWGGELGIAPDLVTFNMLLRTLVRDRRHDDVKTLLRHMETQGLRPDVATFTTIFDGALLSENATNSQEQLEIVDSLLADMETAGIRPNLHTFTAIIKSLIECQNNDLSAVQVILARMSARNIQPSSHIFTMLLQHYFKQEVPDLEAIRQLIDQIRLSKSSVDYVLWDLVIIQYARIGETGSALNILGKVDKEGCRVKWWTLEMVIRSLMANGERELAEEVVTNARVERGGPPDAAEKGVEGRRQFWATAAAWGLGGFKTSDT